MTTHPSQHAVPAASSKPHQQAHDNATAAVATPTTTTMMLPPIERNNIRTTTTSATTQAIAQLMLKRLRSVLGILVQKERTIRWTLAITLPRLEDSQQLRYLAALNGWRRRLRCNEEQQHAVRALLFGVRAAAGTGDAERLLGLQQEIKAIRV